MREIEIKEQYDVFPAHAGMNRGKRHYHQRTASVPRTRGDEP